MNAKEEARDTLQGAIVARAQGEMPTAEVLEYADAYAALCVAEARAPLVEALKEAHAGLVAILTIPSASAAYDDAIAAAKDGRAAAVAALAKETPDA